MSRGPSASWVAGAPTLSTNAVTLREPEPLDAEPLWRHLTTQEVARMMSEPPASPEGFRRFFEWLRRERAAGRCLGFAVWPAGHTEPVGLIQARSLEAGFGIAEWGFCIGRSHWGTGLFLEAASALADFLFRDVGVERLEARVAVPNERAAHALAKLGAEPAGTLRVGFERSGERYDQVLWTISGKNWLARVADAVAVVEPCVGCTDTVESLSVPGGPSRYSDAPEVLTGSGCELRALVDDDAPLLATLLSAPAVTRFIAAPPNGSEGFLRFIQWTQRQRAIGRSFVFGVVPSGVERAVGIFQLHSVNAASGVAEWGFVLGQPYWGTGLFRQGAELLLSLAFETMKIRRLEARAAFDNSRADHALRAVGATPECRLRRSFLVENGYHDDVLWSLLDEEWRARAARGSNGPAPAPVR